MQEYKESNLRIEIFIDGLKEKKIKFDPKNKFCAEFDKMLKEIDEKTLSDEKKKEKVNELRHTLAKECFKKSCYEHLDFPTKYKLISRRKINLIISDIQVLCSAYVEDQMLRCILEILTLSDATANKDIAKGVKQADNLSQIEMETETEAENEIGSDIQAEESGERLRKKRVRTSSDTKLDSESNILMRMEMMLTNYCKKMTDKMDLNMAAIEKKIAENAVNEKQVTDLTLKVEKLTENLENAIKGIDEKNQLNSEKFKIFEEKFSLIDGLMSRVKALEDKKPDKFRYVCVPNATTSMVMNEELTTREDNNSEINNDEKNKLDSIMNGIAKKDSIKNNLEDENSYSGKVKKSAMNETKKEDVVNDEKKQRNFKRKYFSKGINNEANELLEAGEVWFSYYVGRCSVKTTEAGIKQYIENKINSTAKVNLVKESINDFHKWKAYKISVDMKFSETILEPSNWPRNVIVRRWWEKKQSMENKNVNSTNGVKSNEKRFTQMKNEEAKQPSIRDSLRKTATNNGEVQNSLINAELAINEDKVDDAGEQV